MTAIAIEALPKIDSQLLSNIETLIIASLKSRQRVIVNESIQMWNRTFGIVDSLEYPVALRPVLLKLRVLTDILLPNFPDGVDSDVRPLNSQCFNESTNASKIDYSPLKFVETQIDEEQAPRNQNNSTSKPSSREAWTLRKSNTNGGRVEGFDTSRSSPNKPSPKTTPLARARPRHDDSQMQFAAIESSPIASEADDSRLLTDHQKEVRERQELEVGVMFPGLRSTPRPRAREQGEVLPKLILKGTQGSRIEIDAADCCPILPTADDILDDISESSPTPRSSIRRSPNNQLFSSRAPSSIPIKPHIHVGSSHNNQTASLNGHANCEAQAEGDLLNVVDESASELQIRVETDRLNASRKPLPLQLDAAQDKSLAPDSGTFSRQSLDQDMFDADPPSDLDVFIDAPSDPLPTTENDMHEQRTEIPASQLHSRDRSKSSDNIISEDMIQKPVTPHAQINLPSGQPSNWTTPKEDEVSKIMDSFQDSEASQIPSDEDQIAAQLASDLERASTHAKADRSRLCLPVDQKAAKASRKRKGSTRNPGRPAKKLKALLQPSTIQVVVESRRPNDDYVSVDEIKPCHPHKDKKETSPIPSKITRASARRSNSKNYKSRLRSGDSSRSVSAESHLLPSNETLITESRPRLDDAALERKTTPQALPEPTEPAHSSISQSHGLRGSATQPYQSSKDVVVTVSPSRTTSLHPNEEQTLPWSKGSDVQAVHPIQPETMQQVGIDAPREERSVAQGILAGFKNLLGNLRQIQLGAEEEREMICVLFESVNEVHAAGRRSTGR